jgi:hypothetical protein
MTITTETIEDAEDRGLTPIALFLVDEEGQLFRNLDEDFTPTTKQADAMALMLLLLQVLSSIEAGDNPFAPKKSEIVTDISNDKIAQRVKQMLN